MSTWMILRWRPSKAFRRRRGAQSRDGEGRPCSEIDGSSTHYDSRHIRVGSGAGALRQTRSCGRDIRAGSSRSVSQRQHSARAIGVRSDGPECPLHGSAAEDRTIRGVSIANEISRRVVPRERLGDLARDPLRGWVCRHAKRHPKSSSVAHNDKAIQNLESDPLQDKEFNRRDAVGVIAEERPPALRRWPRVAAHVPSNRRLGDLEAELEQLTMNTRRAPKCDRTAHLANERAQLSRDLRSANTGAGSPAPIRPKPSTMPANDGLRPDNRKYLKDGRKPAIEPNK